MTLKYLEQKVADDEKTLEEARSRQDQTAIAAAKAQLDKTKARLAKAEEHHRESYYAESCPLRVAHTPPNRPLCQACGQC